MENLFRYLSGLIAIFASSLALLSLFGDFHFQENTPIIYDKYGRAIENKSPWPTILYTTHKGRTFEVFPKTPLTAGEAATGGKLVQVYFDPKYIETRKLKSMAAIWLPRIGFISMSAFFFYLAFHPRESYKEQMKSG